MASPSPSNGGGTGGRENYNNNNDFGILKPTRKRETKIKWTPENDRKLLLIGFGKELSAKEYKLIAEWFPEKPTPKAVNERCIKLRKEQMVVLGELHMTDPEAELPELGEEAAGAAGSESKEEADEE